MSIPTVSLFIYKSFLSIKASLYVFNAPTNFDILLFPINFVTLSHFASLLLERSSHVMIVPWTNHFVLFNGCMIENYKNAAFHITLLVSKTWPPSYNLVIGNYQEKCSLLEEIKEINNLLIDSEIVIGEKDSIQSAAGGAAEDGEGLVIKFLFNAVTFNQNLISHLSADKKVNYFIFCFELCILIFVFYFIDYVYWSCSQ